MHANGCVCESHKNGAPQLMVRYTLQHTSKVPKRHSGRMLQLLSSAQTQTNTCQCTKQTNTLSGTLGDTPSTVRDTATYTQRQHHMHAATCGGVGKQQPAPLPGAGGCITQCVNNRCMQEDCMQHPAKSARSFSVRHCTWPQGGRGRSKTGAPT